MNEMTTATAAGHLQVSERQVERLARAGELVITRNVGRSLLLDSASVHVWVGRNRRQGRPWSAATAWAALALLSGETVDWMAASALSRLRHRLRNSEAADLAWLVRRRATVHRMQGWGDDTGLQRTGVSALRDLHIAALFDLSAVERGTDGYVRAGDFDSVTRKLGMIRDVSGDVRVRVVPNDAGYAADHLLIAAVAVDLMESLDTRESAAALRMLQGLLNDFRTGNSHLNR